MPILNAISNKITLSFEGTLAMKLEPRHQTVVYHERGAGLSLLLRMLYPRQVVK